MLRTLVATHPVASRLEWHIGTSHIVSQNTRLKATSTLTNRSRKRHQLMIGDALRETYSILTECATKPHCTTKFLNDLKLVYIGGFSISNYRFRAILSRRGSPIVDAAICSNWEVRLFFRNAQTCCFFWKWTAIYQATRYLEKSRHLICVG